MSDALIIKGTSGVESSTGADPAKSIRNGILGSIISPDDVKSDNVYNKYLSSSSNAISFSITFNSMLTQINLNLSFLTQLKTIELEGTMPLF